MLRVLRTLKALSTSIIAEQHDYSICMAGRFVYSQIGDLVSRYAPGFGR